jgi:hypothetical protein
VLRFLSDEIPDRTEIIRSTIITIIFTAIFLSFALAFWAWSAPDVESPVDALNEINPFIPIIAEILFLFCFFVFSSITVINLRLFITKVRAGWAEVILLLILTTAMSWLMFDYNVALPALVLSMGFVVYLYLLQD